VSNITFVNSHSGRKVVQQAVFGRCDKTEDRSSETFLYPVSTSPRGGGGGRRRKSGKIWPKTFNIRTRVRFGTLAWYARKKITRVRTRGYALGRYTRLLRCVIRVVTEAF
jgi:hypothetical protein